MKCSGDTPSCTNCAASDLECTYDQGRRDRLKSATASNKNLVNLLKELQLRVGDDDKARIKKALEEHEDDEISVFSLKTTTSIQGTFSVPGDVDHEVKDAKLPTASSDNGLAFLSEDLLRTRISRETGFVGHGAEVHWLCSLQDRLRGEKVTVQASAISAFWAEPFAKGPPSATFSEINFYLDAESAALDVEVNPHDLPPRDLAEKLLDCYMKTVHKSFPILPPQFEDQFRRYFDALAAKKPFKVPDKWLAILNLVLAIGARYSHLINAEWQGEVRDHLVYMARALRLLGPWPFAAAPDLALIQAVSLIASLIYLYKVLGANDIVWASRSLLPSYRTCQQSMGHSWHGHSSGSSSRVAPAQSCVRNASQ